MKQTFNIDDVISVLQNLKNKGFETCHIDVMTNVPFYDNDTYRGWTMSELLINGVDERDRSYNDVSCIHGLDKKYV